MSMSKTKKLKPAIAYTRVSTKEQGETGNGFELQMIRIREYAREAGYQLINTFSDVQTGVEKDNGKDRPGARAAIDLAQENKWPIIVDGLDRFSRNTKKLEEVVLGGKLKVISAKSGEGAGRAVIMAEAARAQEEAERISRTTKEGLKRARAEGKVLGNPKNLKEAQRKGADKNKEKASKRTEELLPVVLEIRQHGMSTAAQIAEDLNRRGLRTERGERWSADNIRRPLRRVDQLHKQREHEENMKNPMWGLFS